MTLMLGMKRDLTLLLCNSLVNPGMLPSPHVHQVVGGVSHDPLP